MLAVLMQALQQQQQLTTNKRSPARMRLSRCLCVLMVLLASSAHARQLQQKGKEEKPGGEGDSVGLLSECQQLLEMLSALGESHPCLQHSAAHSAPC